MEFDYPSVEVYLSSMSNTEKWLTVEHGTYRITDLPGFIQGTKLPRGKSVPGFDTFHCTAENNAFGKADEKGVHFSASVSGVLAQYQGEYQKMSGYSGCDVDTYIT